MKYIFIRSKAANRVCISDGAAQAAALCHVPKLQVSTPEHPPPPAAGLVGKVTASSSLIHLLPGHFSPFRAGKMLFKLV